MKAKSNKGFTGVDIAVSTVILIIFVSLITTIFYNLSVTSKKIERKTIATNLAIQTIEAMKIIEFDDLTETITIDKINNLIEKKIEIPNGYEIEVAVDNITYPDIIKIISAQVNYKSGKNDENVKIETLVKNNNLLISIPKIECIEIKNSNTNYPLYANSEKEINLTIKITDNTEIEKIDLSKIVIKVGDDKANCEIKWTEKVNESNEKIYNLCLTNVKGDGILTINFEQGFAINEKNKFNTKTNIDTQINIDNTKPLVNYTQEKISNGKVKAILTANEKIQQLNEWNISEDKIQLNKDFVSNVSYELEVFDLAGNHSTVSVNVTGATYISIIYASHNSRFGWSYGYGNYDIAGEKAVKEDSRCRTEALAFRITGNITDEFVMGRAYVYSYWGPGSQAICSDTGMVYSYGYNPSTTSWKTMASNDLVTINGQKYFQFGGAGMNENQKTDINGNNPLPNEKPQYVYGISGIALALKDYTDYSIVYQIYVSDTGWIKSSSNGEETMYAYNNPMSAFRVALIATSEKNNLINTWDKEIGQKIQ